MKDFINGVNVALMNKNALTKDAFELFPRSQNQVFIANNLTSWRIQTAGHHTFVVLVPCLKHNIGFLIIQACYAYIATLKKQKK